MSDHDRTRWNGRYTDGSYQSRTHASPFVVDWIEKLEIEPGANALDIACGLGRNARYLATKQFKVEGQDISSVALQQANRLAQKEGLDITYTETDFDIDKPSTSNFDVIVVARFINRTLNKHLAGMLRPGGWLIYEHHLKTDSDVGGPKDPDFRFDPNELLEVCAPLRLVFYEEVIDQDPDGRTMALVRAVACNDL